MKKFLTPLLLLCCSSAYAATCSVSASSVTFPPYDVFSAIASDSTGSITVSCTQSLPVTISLSSGSSGSFSMRKMLPLTGGSDRLIYNIYTTASLTTVWGDGSGGSARVSAVVPNKKVPLTLTIFGRIPAQQDVSVGRYGDTLTATALW